MDAHFETFAPEFSNGFRPARGCTDALFILKEVLRKRKEHGLHTWLLFLDITAAFDRVPRDLLWLSLKVCGVAPKLIRVLQALYTDRTGVLTIDGASSVLQVGGGTCQGALLAPRLFSYYIYVVLEIWLSDNLAGLTTMLCGTGVPAPAAALLPAALLPLKLGLFNVADDTAAIFPSRESLQLHGGNLIHLLLDFG